MTDRREQVTDAAIRVLGGHGLRRLTHRAVDAEAGLPAGSTSNYLRTRDALLGAVVTRLGELDRADWRRLVGGAPPNPDHLPDLLARVVTDATGPQRHRTLARQALFVEAAVDPQVRQLLTRGWVEILDWASRWLEELGFSNPEQDSRLLLEYLDGLILHQLALAEPDFHPAGRIRRLLAGISGSPDRAVDRP